MGINYFRIIKYVTSGVSAAVVNLAILYLLADIFGFWYLTSSMMAFVVAFGVSFFLQKFWTFEERSTDNVSSQLGLFLTIQLVNLLINTLLIYILVEFAGLWHIIAQIISGLLLATSSFFIFKKLIFNVKN